MIRRGRPRWRRGLIRLADPAGYPATHNRLPPRYRTNRPPTTAEGQPVSPPPSKEADYRSAVGDGEVCRRVGGFFGDGVDQGRAGGGFCANRPPTPATEACCGCIAAERPTADGVGRRPCGPQVPGDLDGWRGSDCHRHAFGPRTVFRSNVVRPSPRLCNSAVARAADGRRSHRRGRRQHHCSSPGRLSYLLACRFGVPPGRRLLRGRVAAIAASV